MLVTEGARVFGNQAIVISIDVMQHPNGKREVFIDGGRTATGLDPVGWAKEAERLGAGEVLYSQSTAMEQVRVMILN